ncbi:hypothetical protein ALMP_07220 [Streptomyces sp. A012304]|nr:hypothetical protein ALMP_07220 [Streptomyces sp. A012304]
MIGSREDTLAAADWPGHEVLNMPRGAWTSAQNDKWVEGIIGKQQTVYVATPEGGGGPYFARELEQLQAAGYRRVGDYLIPPQ